MQNKVERYVVEGLVTAVVVLDGELRVRYLNPAAEAMMQMSSTQAIGEPITNLLILRDNITEALQQTLQDRQGFTERDTTLRLPENLNTEVDFTVNVLDGPNNEEFLLLELQSLDRLKRINKDDESVNRQETTRQLIRGLAHEVKNPLGGIRGAAQLLEGELTDETLTEYTSVIISEADRLSILVDRMLGSQQKLEFAPVNMHKITERVMQLVDAEFGPRVTWQRDYDPSLPDLLGDESQLIQAILNVVRNAVQALSETEDPRIQICSRGIRQFTIGQHRHRLVMLIEIIDNGPGIDEGMQERIFFPMISGRADGHGLGLAIAQNVVTQHQGSVQVASKPGRTCFSIYLPFEPVSDEHTDE